MNNETKRGTYSVQDMVRISVLVAIMLLLEVTGLGMIKMPGLEITLLMVPVIVGAIVMGPASGAILGGVFGCISFWECFGRSQFGAVLLGINPIYTFLVCVPTRILAGWLCGVAFKGLNKLDKTNLWSFGAAGLIGALCKEPNLRITPMGRDICDLMLAVNRRYGRSDYLPCICWGLKAREAATWMVGTQVKLEGRIQSRRYIKMTEDGPVERTAFEVSVIQAEAVTAALKTEALQ